MCLNCSSIQYGEFKFCPCWDCLLWIYRFGKRSATILKQVKQDKRDKIYNVLLHRKEFEKCYNTKTGEVEKKCLSTL